MAEYDRSATGPLPVDAGPRRAESIFDLSPEDFRASLGEMQALGRDTDALMRQYRARNSIFAPINNAAEAQAQGLADSGRRSVLGGLLSKPEGAMGMDALAGLEFEGLGGLLGAGQAVGQALDAPAAAARGLIPQADVNMEALNTAGMAMGAGGATQRLRRGVGQASQAAADTYMIGDRLAAPQGYANNSGRPSNVGLLGQSFEARPISAIEDAATEYMRRRGMDTTKLSQYPEFSEERGRLIASAYDMMRHDPTNPDVRRAYDAMIGETLDQYKSLQNSGIDFRFIPEGMPDPYAASPALGYQDLVENGKLWVFPTDQGFGSLGADVADNPLLTRVGRIGDLQDATANDAFRAVHDTFGHFGPGNPFFRRQGEERAFLEHQRMYSPEARGAMTSETRGQNSWLNSGPYGQANRTALGGDTVFADQKTGLLSPWAQDPSGMPGVEERKYLENYMAQNGWAQ
jgi:hypothetical protein